MSLRDIPPMHPLAERGACRMPLVLRGLASPPYVAVAGCRCRCSCQYLSTPKLRLGVAPVC